MFKNKASIVMSIAAVGVVVSTGIGYAAEKGVVTADSLNIRSGPSTSYSIKAKAKKGTVLNLGKKENGWYEVSLANGVSGWASGSYIEVTDSVEAQTGEILEATYLRDSESWSANKLALLKEGIKVEVISTSENWTKAKFNGQVGYIANDYVKVSSVPGGGQEGGDVTGQTSGKILEATYLRDSESWSANKLALLKEGVKVEVISTSENWTKAKFNGQVGYIANDYVEVENDGSTPTLPEENTETGEIVDATYLREKADWGSTKLILLQKGVKVEVLSSDENWTKVKYDGKIGYVSNDYIKGSAGSGEDGGSVSQGKGKILEATYLRDSESWSANKLMVLQPNTMVDIISVGENWTKVKYQGQLGYIGNAYIEIGGTEGESSSTDKKVKAVIDLAKAQLGKPYEWGAEGPNSFDCSGLMYYIYKNGAGITLPRVSRDQAKVGKAVSFKDMKPGDLISFDFDKDGVVSHVGVYIGGGEFIHALKPGTFVQITSTSSSYWKDAIYGIRRIIE